MNSTCISPITTEDTEVNLLFCFLVLQVSAGVGLEYSVGIAGNPLLTSFSWKRFGSRSERRVQSKR